MQRLLDRTAVVTGASTGIGRAVAISLAAEGANVVVNYVRSAAQAESVVADIKACGGEAIAIQADVSVRDAVGELLDVTIRSFGAVEIWINNAGADILTGSNSELSDPEKLDLLVATDLYGTIFGSWAAGSYMKANGRGAIVNMSWDLALHGLAGRIPQLFAAVKAGVVGFSKSYAREMSPEVRVNVIAPGWITTKFAESTMDKSYLAARRADIPMGRFGTPEDVAGVVTGLVTMETDYLTGQVIRINGGLV